MHDRMTEEVYAQPLRSFATSVLPEPFFTVPVLAQGMPPIWAVFMSSEAACSLQVPQYPLPESCLRGTTLAGCLRGLCKPLCKHLAGCSPPTPDEAPREESLRQQSGVVSLGGLLLAHARCRPPARVGCPSACSGPQRLRPAVRCAGAAALEAINDELGLAFDEWDVQYYARLFGEQLRRDPTNVELFDIAQSNSEHRRAPACPHPLQMMQASAEAHAQACWRPCAGEVTQVCRERRQVQAAQARQPTAYVQWHNCVGAELLLRAEATQCKECHFCNWCNPSVSRALSFSRALSVS